MFESLSVWIGVATVIVTALAIVFLVSRAIRAMVDSPDPVLIHGENRRVIVIALALDILLILLAAALVYWRAVNNYQKETFHIEPIIWAPHPTITTTATLMLIAIITFFGFYLHGDRQGINLDSSTRNAIAAAFVVLYFSILANVILAPGARAALGPEFNRDPDPALGITIFNGFTEFLKVVLGFYFGTQAVKYVADAVVASQVSKATVDTAQSPTVLDKTPGSE
jgi:hypothetical protein